MDCFFHVADVSIIKMLANRCHFRHGNIEPAGNRNINVLGYRYFSNSEN